MTERHMCRKCGEWLSKLGGKPLKYHSLGKDVKDTCYCCGKRRFVLAYEIDIVEEENDDGKIQ